MKMVMAIALATGALLAAAPGAALAQDRLLLDRGGGGGGGGGRMDGGGSGGREFGTRDMRDRDVGGRAGGGGGGAGMARDAGGRDAGEPRILRRPEPGAAMDRGGRRDRDPIVRPVRPGDGGNTAARKRDRDRELYQVKPGKVVIDRNPDRDRKKWKRWRPGSGWGVVVVPSYVYGADLGWCHYHRYPVAGLRFHRDVRCHYHASWRHPSIAYVAGY